MRIYAPSNFERQFRHNMSSAFVENLRCKNCSRSLSKIGYLDSIQKPYIASYIGEDFHSVEFSVPTVGGVLICSERALNVLKETVPDVFVVPALLQKIGKRNETLEEREMYAVLPMRGVVLDSIIFKMNRIVDCFGCGCTSWAWSGDQGVYPFRGEQKTFHFFHIIDGGMATCYSEKLIANLRDANVLGVPSIRNAPAFGEWMPS